MGSASLSSTLWATAPQRCVLNAEGIGRGKEGGREAMAMAMAMTVIMVMAMAMKGKDMGVWCGVGWYGVHRSLQLNLYGYI